LGHGRQPEAELTLLRIAFCGFVSLVDSASQILVDLSAPHAAPRHPNSEKARWSLVKFH